MAAARGPTERQLLFMTDYFALLDEPRRLWLDPEFLKEKFLARSAVVHPDRVHNLGKAEQEIAQDRYVQLNSAYNCLREPKARLRHLLEVELGAVPKEVQPVPPDLMDLFMEIGQACRQADAAIAENSAATSPLLKVQLFERSQEQADKLRSLLQKVAAGSAHLTDRLKQLDEDRDKAESSAGTAHPQFFSEVEKLYRLFSYFDRWTAQIQERVVKLSF
jgi:DnaJ-domain-containing protein 1